MTPPAAIAAVSPVLAWEELVGQPWDVLVAGAGPAGATIARHLARRGVSVLLVDKASFPRWKVCGCCLNGAAIGALAASGLGDLPARLGAVPLTRMQLAVGTTRASLVLPAGASLSREAFDSALIQAAVDAGVAFLPETEALLQPEAAETRHVRLKQGARQTSVAARVVVAADGLSGKFLKSHPEMATDIAAAAPIGAGTVFEQAPDFYSQGTIFMACSRGVYVGAVRLEDGRLEVAAALQPWRLRQSMGLGELLGRALDECRFPRPADMTEAGWRGTPPLTHFRKRMGGHRLVVVGDAAGYVEPFTGEGMSWAIQAAILAVPFVLDGLEEWRLSLPRNWESRYRQFFCRRERVCLLVRKLLNYRCTARTAVASLRLAPWLASPWMRRIVHVDPEVLAIANVHGRLT
jgi:flavin-dependent dehydrogenase